MPGGERKHVQTEILPVKSLPCQICYIVLHMGCALEKMFHYNAAQVWFY